MNWDWAKTKLNDIRARPITMIVGLLSIAGFILFRPSSIAIFETLPPAILYLLYPVKLILGSLLHVHLQHLLMNLAIWLIAGAYLEPKIGSGPFLAIALIATLVGGLLETVLIDPQFVGLSAACYGLIGLLIWNRFANGKGLKGAFQGAIIVMVVGAADTAFNIIASPDNIAYAAHIGGLMAGFLSSFGFKKSGGSGGPNRIFRPMLESDIKPVLDIIFDHDEDDGEDAERAFAETLADKYVMEFEGRVMGMTGFRTDYDSPNTAWLSFTYIHEYFRKGGNAYWMMLELRNVLNSQGVQRLFIATSDYIDGETGEDIYLAARNFYEHKLNAEPQLKVDDYYAPGESKYIYSLPVSPIFNENPPSQDTSKNHTARFVGLDQASESDTSYVTLWEEMTPQDTEPKSKLPTKSFAEMIEEVQSYGGKALFVTLPEGISANHGVELKTAGFKELGILEDYFAPGVGEVYWGLYLA